jgi:pimeloyl-ACP methyl ester carboxylesterase
VWRLGLAVAALSVLAGCGDAARSADPSPTATATPPAAVATCGLAGGSWQSLAGTPVDAAALGRGPAVVFANDSGNDPCGWIPLAERLAAHGHRAAVFTYSDTSSVNEKYAVNEALAVARAAAGGQPYALVGASLGGRVVIEAAARRPPGLAAIVSLSGERTVEDYRDILRDARRVRTPTLYIGAREDPLTDGARQQRELHAAMRGRPNRLFQQPGAAHGVDLIQGGTDTPPAQRLTAFVTQELR